MGWSALTNIKGDGSPGWLPYRHNQLIDRKLLDLFNPEHALNRMGVILGRQFGKTKQSSEGAAGFFVGHNPDDQVGVISYNASRAAKIGGQVRDAFERYGSDVFGVTVNQRSRARSEWTIKGHGGGVIASGLDGRLNGECIRLLILDDLFKNDTQALSPVYRDHVWNWFTTTALPCVPDDGYILIVNTRWHPDDFFGRMLAMIMQHANVEVIGHPISPTAVSDQADLEDIGDDSERWLIVNLPALAERDEYIDGELFRESGQSLCPALKSEKVLKRRRVIMGDWAFRAVMQGDPSEPEGYKWSECFSETQFIPALPKELEVLGVYTDPASGKKKKGTSYSATVAGGACGDGYLYVDCKLRKSNFAATLENIIDLVRNRLPRIPDVFGFEETGVQGELLIQATTVLPSALGEDIDLRGLSHGGVPKPVRINRLDPWITGKRLRFVDSTDNRLLVRQLKLFGASGENDDGPDALEGLVRMLSLTIAEVAAPEEGMQDGPDHG
jgi:hypothetical protein